MSLPIEEYLLDAVAVISWETPDEELADVVNAQARLMAGISPDEYWCLDSEAPAH